MADNDSVVVITGGSGGMGQACARRLGKNHALLLVDINAAAVEATASALRAEGYRVTPCCADLAKPEVIEQLVAKTQSLGPLRALVHTAGLSPTMADARRIMDVNWVATYRLAEAFLPIAQPGSCAVLIASISAYLAPARAELDALLDDPLAPDFWSKIESFAGTPEASYSFSKRAVLRYCERVVAQWGARGARIASISPGVIATPMGKKELEDKPMMAAMVAMTPMQRQGSADDIAAGVEFLCSDAASFITGTDLRIDGGVIPVMLSQRR
jgi:NAD(P)-dependent dehydrogenase (short-subunit alcohol dehydrogenase family)